MKIEYRVVWQDATGKDLMTPSPVFTDLLDAVGIVNAHPGMVPLSHIELRDVSEWRRPSEVTVSSTVVKSDDEIYANRDNSGE